MEKHINVPLKNHDGYSTWTKKPTAEQLDLIEDVAAYFYEKRREADIDRVRKPKTGK
jgi:hypothetical protein